MANINIYGTFRSMAEDQKVVSADQVVDDNVGKDQETINEEVQEALDNISTDALSITYDDSITQLGAGNVQEAIEVLTEDVVDILGDESYYWADMLREYGGLKASTNVNYLIRRTAVSGGYNEGSLYPTRDVMVFLFDVKAGEKWKVEGLLSISDRHAYALYDSTVEEMHMANIIDSSTNKADMDGNTWQSIIQGLANHFVSGDAYGGSADYDYSAEITIPTGVKSMAVQFIWSNSDSTRIRVPGVSMNVYKWVQHKPIDLSKATCRLIEGWSEESVIANNATDTLGYCNNAGNRVLEIGDLCPIIVNEEYSSYNSGLKVNNINAYQYARLGSRLVRIDVKEGDKLLLDIFSPTKYSLIYTNTDYEIVALNEQRRLYGVYTSPCDGYLYIQDTLHRDNYIYDNAHGYLAYQMMDNKKNSAVVVQDYYNEVAPTLIEEQEVECTTSAVNFTFTMPYYYQIATDNRYVLVALRVNTYNDVVSVPSNAYYAIPSNNNAHTQVSTTISTTTVSSTIGVPTWITQVILTNVTNVSVSLRLTVSNLPTNTYIHYKIDKVFVHTFDTADEAFVLKGKFDKGLIDVDNNGTIIETNSVESAVGMASISLLGYDILSKGATLPIDNDGVAYALPLKGQAGRTFNGVPDADNGDKNLVYLPVMDWSGFTGSPSHVFYGCWNLITIPDIEWNTGLKFNLNTFRACYSLKQVGNLPTTGYQTFQDCYSLTKVGNITKLSDCRYMFSNCYSLVEIGTLDGFEDVVNMGRMFKNCISLENFPDEIDASSCTTMQEMFYGCVKMVTMPNIINSEDTTNMQSMVDYCRTLVEIPALDSSKNTTFRYFARNCSSLKRVESLDFDVVTDITGIFQGCDELEELTINNLGKSSLTSYDFSALVKWGTTSAGHDTLYASLYTNSAPAQNITVKLSTASYNALTQAERDNITSKGITLTK